MASGEPDRYLIEIDQRDPVRGRISDLGGHTQREFYGWLGAAAALELMLTTPSPSVLRVKSPAAPPIAGPKDGGESLRT